jgi:pSer/pThr/pTyr-binding forkhead associated (FHA) protein
MPLAIKLSSTVSLRSMAYVYCNQCGHRNPPDSGFCSSCGAVLDRIADHTITLAKVDPLQEAPGPDDDIVVNVADLDVGVASLIVRSGPQAGAAFGLRSNVTRLGRHPDSEISLDDITVSRRHAEVERTAQGYVVRDAGSLNGTYVNAERIDNEVVLHQGDELQIGKFRLVFFERSEA